jgi:DICT domain-containing protein
MWETRYGFPRPERRPSGHRRYSEAECERVWQVIRDRDAGLSLPAAIEKHRGADAGRESSVFAGLRRRRPDLTSYVLPKRTLLAMSHAIEDECCSRAERPFLLASFQRERHYREAEARWRDLARTADLSVAFADFPRRRDPPGGPVELPIRSDAALGREWTLLCAAMRYSACLSAWERPGQGRVSDSERVFETVWTVDAGAVQVAMQIGSQLMAEDAPDLVERLRERLDRSPSPSGEQAALVAALSSRMVAYVGGAEDRNAFARPRP